MPEVGRKFDLDDRAQASARITERRAAAARGERLRGRSHPARADEELWGRDDLPASPSDPGRRTDAALGRAATRMAGSTGGGGNRRRLTRLLPLAIPRQKD